MIKEEKLRLLKVLHFVLTISIFVGGYVLFYGAGLNFNLHIKADLLLFSVYSVLLFLFLRIYCGYGIGSYSITDLCFSQSIAQLISIFTTYFMLAFRFMKLLNPLPLFGVLFCQVLINVIWTKFTNHFYFAGYKRNKVVLIYTEQSSKRRISEIKDFALKYEIVKELKGHLSFEHIISELNGIECIFVSGVDATLRNELAKYCVKNDIVGYFAPHIGDVIMLGAKHETHTSVPFLLVKQSSPTPEYLLVKRAFDILVSLIAIVLFSPLMLITGIMIKLYDGGPVFYKQVRLTIDRKEFKIVKFRSMRVDAERDGIARLSTENDNRITPIGRVIRAIRFDELPQLFNILKGDMTIVGPRPERPEIAEQYEEYMPEFALRLQVKAGLTGFAQVYGKYNTDPYDKLQFDLMYINKMGVIEDLRLMFMTVKTLFTKESTSGVTQGAITAHDIDCRGNADESVNAH